MDEVFTDEHLLSKQKTLPTYDLSLLTTWLQAKYPCLQKIQLYGAKSEDKFIYVHSARIHSSFPTLGLDLTWGTNGNVTVHQFCRKCGYTGHRETNVIRCFNPNCAEVLAPKNEGLYYASLAEQNEITLPVERLLGSHYDTLAGIMWAQDLFDGLTILALATNDLAYWMADEKYLQLSPQAQAVHL